MSLSVPAEPHRVIRHVEEPDESPYSGALVRDGAGETLVAVDAARFGTDWPGWRAGADGHLLAPVDVVRRRGGHEVLLPFCPETLGAALDRRTRERRRMSSGELVTLGVSIARAMGELGSAASVQRGQWWLTALGRPVLAVDAGTMSARQASIDLTARVEAGAVASAWAVLLAALDADAPSPRALEAAEGALFAAAMPEALRTDALSPRPARPDAVPAVDARPAGGAAAIGHEEGWLMRTVRAVDIEGADIAARLGTALWRGARRPGSRRRVWALAAAVAAGTVAVGALWPPADGASPARVGSGDASAPSPVTTPSAGEDAAGIALEDPVAAAEDLLARRNACGADASCLADTQEQAAQPLPAGAIALAPDQLDVTLIDDLGDVSVLRVAPLTDEAMPQIAVIARVNGEWLLRDVYDVAQQP